MWAIKESINAYSLMTFLPSFRVLTFPVLLAFAFIFVVKNYFVHASKDHSINWGSGEQTIIPTLKNLFSGTRVLKDQNFLGGEELRVEKALLSSAPCH